MPRDDTFKSATLRELTSALRKLEGQTLLSQARGTVSTGLPVLDALLPERGLRRGTVVEWVVDGPGTSVERLALAIVPHALRPQGTCVVVDHRQEFFPPGAAAAGIDLERLAILRPCRLDDALWGTEQALRCPAVDVVVAWDELVPRGRSHDRIFRRLQLAAEESGSLGVFLRPAVVQRYVCWGELRVLVNPRAASPPATLVDLTLLHCRGRVQGATLTVEIDDETGAVRLVPPLAVAATAERATGA